jgi:hypothetical protein
MRPNSKEPESAPCWFQSPNFARMAASYIRPHGGLLQRFESVLAAVFADF